MVQATGLNLRAQYLRDLWPAKEFKPYNDTPVGRNRDQYRATHPDVEAKLFITGQITSLGDPPHPKAIAAAVQLMKANGIGIKDIPSMAVKPDESPARTALRDYLVKALTPRAEGATRFKKLNIAPLPATPTPTRVWKRLQAEGAAP